jgi:hypothetical protein
LTKWISVWRKGNAESFGENLMGRVV